jgi:hypothetical protein
VLSTEFVEDWAIGSVIAFACLYKKTQHVNDAPMCFHAEHDRLPMALGHVARAGRPVRLNFRREETATCSDKVIFADFDKSAELPTGETVRVELLPKEPGEFTFACPMGMFRGKLIVE